MTLIEALSIAKSGARITRTSDKRANLPFRASISLDVSDVESRLTSLAHGRMFPVPGLQRMGADGKWRDVGALMSHQAAATDWEVVE